MLRRTLLLPALALGATAAPAAAHVEVLPKTVAPADPVLFTVLVPGERDDTGTTEVKLQIPEGVLPFSFEDQPGWKRTVQRASNGALETVTWKGKAAADGLVALRFLASTPDAPGTIEWKSIQTYDDGDVVRWIGAEGSESPASTTTVSADAPRQNAGGEGAQAASPDAGTGGAAAPQADTTQDAAGAASPDAGDDGGRDGLTLGLAIAGLVAGLAALGVTVTRGRATA
ncbi:DUF1775 domain-containing protein [Conexibacter sp. W3-3-2]|uniref:DUF1775 domain-containing protein n=1 Tax=Conexibacter sp. W3-3-2 TaxID=2675227 RepID=UPI0012B8CA0F|nr:DUF1775 domain-containing protein [Conexibacter sp. W3-3-2]MTD45125.1 DUF1775 domain-containing protein [Conexibacter sp. W3-3-2]